MSGADIFGLVTTVGGPLEIGQWWEPNAMFRFTPRSPGVVSFELRKNLDA